eukprot:SAG11_NODE_2372_length_3446_cov_9.306543_2_plen_64_part_00
MLRLAVEPPAATVDVGEEEPLVLSEADPRCVDLTTAERSCSAPIGVDGMRELIRGGFEQVFVD